MDTCLARLGIKQTQKESRRQRIRKSWSPSHSTKASRIRLKWNNIHRAPSEHQQGTLTTERTRKIPSQRGRTKETRRKRVRRGSGAGPATLEGSSPDGREPHSLMGREGSTSQRQAGQSETSADGPDPSPAPPSLRGCPPLHTRVGPQMWGLESRPRQRTAVGSEETPEGTGGREELCKRDACGGSLTHHSAEQHC